MRDQVRYRAAFERSRHAMVIVDDDGLIVDANAAAVGVIGTSHDDLVGRDRRRNVGAEAHDLIDEQQQALRDGWAWVGDYEVGAHIGRAVRVDVCAEPGVVPGRHLILYATRDREEQPPESAERGAVPSGDDHRDDVRLTEREREIVGELALGATGPEVAEKLVISEHTVRTHVRNAMERTGARTRAHLVVVAMRAGLVDATST